MKGKEKGGITPLVIMKPQQVFAKGTQAVLFAETPVYSMSNTVFKILVFSIITFVL